MDERNGTTRVQTVVVGGGQAGLSVGYELGRRGLPYVILDASARVGDAWRQRWDSLRLFTPARYTGLPGMRFPGRGDLAPTAKQMATYLETYANHFRLHVHSGMRVDGVERHGDGFLVTAGGERFECENVVVAMSDYQVPNVPSFARELDPRIVQIHSQDYRNPSQLKPGAVLVVGSGNSGADIALELARSHSTWMAGKESGVIPFPIDGFLTRNLLVRLVRFFGHHVLSVATPIGRRLRPRLLHQAAPLVRVKPKDLLDAGVKRTARVTGAKDGLPVLAGGESLDVTNVIWCTGYQHGFPWLHVPAFDEAGEPKHVAGVSAEVPGLYFVGLHFLYSMTSATLLGVGRDARRIVRAVEARVRENAAAGATRGRTRSGEGETPAHATQVA